MTMQMTFSSKYTLIIIFILCLTHISISAQTPIDEALRSTDISAAWSGCDPKMTDCTKSKLAEFISANIKIPAEATAQGAGGVVMIEFVVEKNGKIGEVKTLHDPGYGLGDEAIRVVKLMSAQKIIWTPAREKGKKVPYRYITPVPFNLSALPKELPTMQTEKTSMPRVYDVVEVMPRYAGCEQNIVDSIDCTFMQMIKHIQTNLQYPQEALSIKAQGPVVVDFVIDSTGRVTDPVVTRGLGYGCDAEAIRVISLMPNWIPGMQDGKPVAVKMTIPIMFQIPKKKE